MKGEISLSEISKGPSYISLPLHKIYTVWSHFCIHDPIPFVDLKSKFQSQSNAIQENVTALKLLPRKFTLRNRFSRSSMRFCSSCCLQNCKSRSMVHCFHFITMNSNEPILRFKKFQKFTKQKSTSFRQCFEI